ncbi:hypothetical protein RB653_009829 [Dictyostelium firmibasis]|uniref:Helicase ATP-binding domain-containing protein n=1 Tax=Dictyostelium firmibasis TaxID=79012 RepID=A0AAN7YLI3_9MYCE
MNKQEILSLLETKKTLIIVGGDQTENAIEIPQFLNGGFINGNNNKTILCAEPKRSDVIKLAELVSKQMNEEVGKTIGYGIRFEEKVSTETKIKYITDGLLIREMMIDPLLNNYSIVIIDQANERSLHSDLLLALLNRLQSSTRPDLKLIILTSNNSSAIEFNNFFTRGATDNNEVSILSLSDQLLLLPSDVTKVVQPEIQRCKLTTFILQLKALNINNLNSFEMITSPSTESINEALNELFSLGAIITSTKDRSYESSKLTSIGNVMIGLPLDPIYSKIIIESEKLGCSEEILTIISMLQINRNDLFIGKLPQSLIDNQSDHLTLLNVYNSFVSKNKCSSEQQQWCNDNKINYKSILAIQQTKNHLLNFLTKVSIKLLSCENPQAQDLIKKSILSGFFNNIAKSVSDDDDDDISYETIVEPTRKVWLHSNSFITTATSQFVLFGQTTKIHDKEYIKDVSIIDPS